MRVELGNRLQQNELAKRMVKELETPVEISLRGTYSIDDLVVAIREANEEITLSVEAVEARDYAKACFLVVDTLEALLDAITYHFHQSTTKKHALA